MPAPRTSPAALGLHGQPLARANAVVNAWRNPSFRAYAEHVETEEFAQGLEELLHLAAACRTG